MQRFGDDSAGFSVDVPAPDRIEVRGWGFWSVNVASAFEPGVAEACVGRGRGAILTLDMSDVKPMREEGQQSCGRLMRQLSTAGLAKVSIVTTNPLTKLQLVRLVTESRTTAPIEWIAGKNDLARV